MTRRPWWSGAGRGTGRLTIAGSVRNRFSGTWRALSKGAVKRQKADQKEEEFRARSKSRGHSVPQTPFEMGLKDKDAVAVTKKRDRAGRKAWEGLSGEGDQRKSVHLVKWMNTGKKRNGTTYC